MSCLHMSIKISGRFEMKLHVNRTCFHASLQSQTGKVHFASHVNVLLYNLDMPCEICPVKSRFSQYGYQILFSCKIITKSMHALNLTDAKWCVRK